MRPWRFLFGTLLLLVPEILRVYYIMPFPGSQEDLPTDDRQVRLAYWLHGNIWWVRLIGAALIIGPFIHYLRSGGWGKRIAVILPMSLCIVVVYAFNFKFMADRMFYPPKEKRMALPDTKLFQHERQSLVIAVDINGDARAYPIELIGYHHQVLDTIGGEPVLVTYCTVCRTGRAWSPIVNGEQETFRLVGMDHFNAMFEDSRTKSWWRQVSGECIAGPLKGQQLEEVRSEQLSLGEFMERSPRGLVMLPDTNFMEEYEGLAGFDDGTIDSDLEYRDSASWQMKSWVVGVVHNGQARAYDWNDVLVLKVIRDTIGGDSILIRLDDTGVSFKAEYDQWTYEVDSAGVSISTQVYFNYPAYQEFWHSWRTFHPNTTQYTPKR